MKHDNDANLEKPGKDKRETEDSANALLALVRTNDTYCHSTGSEAYQKVFA